MRGSTIDRLPWFNRPNSSVPTSEDKLRCSLVHIKQNLTQEVHGQLFGMSQSDANRSLQLLRPIFAEALERLDVLPARPAAAMEQVEPPTADDAPIFTMMVPSARPSNP